MAFLEFNITSNGCYVVPTNSPVISSKGKINYPVMRINGKLVKTRKLVFEECIGAIPAGFVIKNTCLNPRCINPEHLTLISRVQMAEEARKQLKRESAPETYEEKYLTDEDIRLAKALLKTRSLEEVAEAFGVSKDMLEVSINMPF